jgi:hypothetical protein
MTDEHFRHEFTIHPVPSEGARLRVSVADGSVVVDATPGVRLSANAARVLANVLNATAKRVEG